VLAAQRRNRTAGFGLLEDGDVLAVGKTGRLHVELSVLKQKILLLNTLFLRGLPRLFAIMMRSALGCLRLPMPVEDIHEPGPDRRHPEHPYCHQEEHSVR
jgi:hypothetical protein